MYFPVAVAELAGDRPGAPRVADDSSTESDVLPMPSNSDSSSKDISDGSLSSPLLASAIRYFTAVGLVSKPLFLLTPRFEVPIPSNRSIIRKNYRMWTVKTVFGDC